MFNVMQWVSESPPFLLLGAWLWGLIVCILNRKLSRWMSLLIAGFGLAVVVWLLIVALVLGYGGRLFSPSAIEQWFFLTVGFGQVLAVSLIVAGLVFLFMDLRGRFEVFRDLLLRQSDNDKEARDSARQSHDIQQ